MLLTGVVYTARDAAHKRLCQLAEAGQPLPFDVKDAVIYYVGPTPAAPGQVWAWSVSAPPGPWSSAAPGQVIGAAGPTTSYRMDAYSPTLIALGQRGMIGKGKRSQAVKDAVVRNGAVYFAAVGGAGALLSRSIISSEVIAYDDLGTEAIRKLEVKDFPVIVVMDSVGNDLYATAIQAYCKNF